ncbi:MAG: NAD(P)-dependent glycerol-3-phosphate dehydrogenase [Deltaproteobacteria bacterium]|nr:MAG: NAD(P)-dependent glycerol-3-phosphate dehydrogenase [Deltaproteobacteria bacterium]
MAEGLRVGVIGAGAWGTALAQLMADNGARVNLWAYETEVVEQINGGENETYLPGIELSRNIRASGELAEVLKDRQLVLLVVPSHVMRQVIRRAAMHLPRAVPIVSASKGIENDTLCTMSEVLEQELDIAYHPMLAFLSGPSFAREVAARHPTAVSVAARFEKVATEVQRMMSGPYFRVYTTTDVTGVELGGALKNVIAIAAGAAVGLGFGANSQAALVTRGLAEITRLAVKMGANPLTLSGLSGMGDLVLTCYGGLSRNRTVGQKLGEGRKIDDILGGMKQVAEGVRTAKSVHQLAEREGVEMPICNSVYRMLYESLPPRQAVVELMSRKLKREIY